MSNSTNSVRSLRLTVLFAILVLMLIGLWYDRNVARPGVEAAWNSIAQLNTKINAEAKAKAMTNVDVQQALNRQPSRTMTQGAFQVEVYSWMAGIPFRTRDYYAVYSPGSGKLFFTTHFKYVIPEGELVPLAEPSDPSQSVPDSEAATAEEMGTAGPQRKGRSRDAGESPDAAANAEEMSAGETDSEMGSEAKESKPESASSEPSAPPETTESSAVSKPREDSESDENAEAASSPAPADTPKP